MSERGSVGVVGCGTMGAGIAEACARAGRDVTVVVLDGRHADDGRDRIEESLRAAAATGRVGDQEARDALARVRFSTEPDDQGGPRS